MAGQDEEQECCDKNPNLGVKVPAGESGSFECDEQTPKARKAYRITRQRQRWAGEEHSKFLEALKLYGRSWRLIQEHIGTKTAVQIRSHAQKFFSKVIRDSSICGGGGGPPGNANLIEIPPPRPKRKPKHPYPRKMARATNLQQNGESSFLLREDNNHAGSSTKSIISSIKLFGATVLVTDCHKPSTNTAIPTPKGISLSKSETSAATVSCLSSDDSIPVGASESMRNRDETATESTSLTAIEMKTTSLPSESSLTDSVDQRSSNSEQNQAVPCAKNAEDDAESICGWSVWACPPLPLFYNMEQSRRWEETIGVGAGSPSGPLYGRVGLELLVAESLIPVNIFNGTEDECDPSKNEKSGKENNQRSSIGSNGSCEFETPRDLIVESSREEEEGASLQQWGRCSQEIPSGCMTSNMGHDGAGFSSRGGFMPYKRCALEEPIKNGHVEDVLMEEKRLRL